MQFLNVPLAGILYAFLSRPSCSRLRCLCLFATRMAQEGEGTLKEMPFQSLSDRSLTPLGQAAMSIHPERLEARGDDQFHLPLLPRIHCRAGLRWRRNFTIGSSPRTSRRTPPNGSARATFSSSRRMPIGRNSSRRAALDPWTGGIHSQGSLFIQRNPELKFKGSTLGHEVTHLVIERFFGSGVPLWLNEGYAEYSASRCYAAFNRARGYAGAAHFAPGAGGPVSSRGAIGRRW